MIARKTKAERNRQEDIKGEKSEKRAIFFTNSPYNSTICDCGGKVVQQGRCQNCLDEFNQDLKKELDQIKCDKQKEKNIFTKTMEIIGTPDFKKYLAS